MFNRSIRYTFIFYLLFLFFLVVDLAIPEILAQETVRSNSVNTAVGNPQVTPPGGGSITPPPDGNYRQALLDNFGLILLGNWEGTENPKWIFEKFTEFAQTRSKFIQQIRGERIELIPFGYSNQLSGYVKVRQYPGQKDLFIAALVHELGHVIYNNRTNDISLKFEHDSLHTSSKQAISTYSVEGITAYSSRSENYAEVIAYCVAGRPIYSAIPSGVSTYRDLGARIVGGCY